MFAVYAAEPEPRSPLDALVVGERPDPEAPDGWVPVPSRPPVAEHARHLDAARRRDQEEQFPMILGCDGAGTLHDGTEVVICTRHRRPGVVRRRDARPAAQHAHREAPGHVRRHGRGARRATPSRMPEGLTAVAGRRDGHGLAHRLPDALRQVRPAAGPDDARAGRVRRRVDRADPAGPRRGDARVGDRAHRGEARRRRAARRARHVPERRAAARTRGRGVRDRGRRHLGALDAGAEAGRCDRRLGLDERARRRAPTCSGCSSCSCGSSARRWAPATSSPTS